jgi:hypothetical protein
MNKWFVIIAAAVTIAALVWWESAVYQPPLLDQGRRNPAEAVHDFFSFAWHFSRQVWARHSRNWPSAGRERLLAFWYHPGFPAYDKLREKSLIELGRAYEQNFLPGRAAEFYLLAHLKARGDLYRASWVGTKLVAMKEWKKLKIVARNILKYHPGDEAGSRWLDLAEEKRSDR